MSLIYRLFYPKKYYTTGDTIGVLNDSIPRITPPLRNILYTRTFQWSYKAVVLRAILPFCIAQYHTSLQ